MRFIYPPQLIWKHLKNVVLIRVNFMNKEEKEFLFNIITLLLASLLGIGGAFVFYFHNISNKEYSIWCPLVFIILIEWLNYRLWIGKKFIEIEVPKKNKVGCIFTGIMLFIVLGTTIYFIPNDLLFIIDSILQGVYLYSIVLLIAYFIIYDMVMKGK